MKNSEEYKAWTFFFFFLFFYLYRKEKFERRRWSRHNGALVFPWIAARCSRRKEETFKEEADRCRQKERKWRTMVIHRVIHGFIKFKFNIAITPLPSGRNRKKRKKKKRYKRSRKIIKRWPKNTKNLFVSKIQKTICTYLYSKITIYRIIKSFKRDELKINPIH